MVLVALRTVIFLSIAINIHALPVPPGSATSGNRWEETPEATEGDMFFAPSRLRGVATRRVGARWTNGIVLYQFLPGFTAAQQAFIVGVLRKMESTLAFNNVPCIQFREKTASDQFYISIMNGAGCSSYVGMPPYANFNHTVSINSIGCLDDGRIMHEMLHTLGFEHEQSRPDRDSYVRVNQANIIPEAMINFVKKNSTDVDTQNTPYDYGSVMHYPNSAFSANGLPTIEPLQPNVIIGQRVNMSAIDIQEVRLYYSCPTSGVTVPPTTTTTTTAIPNITSVYSGALTIYSPQYLRPGGVSAGYYYEIIEISVTKPGSYVFKSNSSMDTYAYVYNSTFNPATPSVNVWLTDDDGNGDRQFRFEITFGSSRTLTLVVTTFSSQVAGTYSVIVTGPGAVTLVQKSTSLSPTTSTTTVPSTTTTTTSTTTKTSTTTTTTSTTTKTSTTTTTSTTTKTSTTTTTSTTLKTSTTTAPASCFPTSWSSSGIVVASGGYYGGLAVDDDFNIYVSDGNQGRLQKWIPGATQPINLLTGQFSHFPLFFHSLTRSLYFVDSILGNPTVYKLAYGQTVPVKVAFGNGRGNASNQLEHDCRGLYVTEAGDIFVLDAYNQRVLKWTVNTNSTSLIAGGGGTGNGSNQMNDALGFYVDTANDVVYVADHVNHRIQKYTKGSVHGITVLDYAYRTPTPAGLRQMYYPQSVFVDRTGNILVGDSARLTKWAPNGSCGGSLIADGIQGIGADAKRMETPRMLVFDKVGNLYALDWANQRVLKFNVTSKSCPA